MNKKLEQVYMYG